MISITSLVGIPGGAEAAVHAAREFLTSQQGDDFVLVKLNMKNAFNSVSRTHLLSICARRCPEIFRLTQLAYGSHGILLVGNSVISSECGVQQGDPLGPLLFVLAVDDIARSVSSSLNMWYLDDATLGGPADIVAADLGRILPALNEIGLVANPLKSEVIDVSCGLEFITKSSGIFAALPRAKVVPKMEVELLGAPIFLKRSRAQQKLNHNGSV